MPPGADIPVIREAQAQFTAYFAGKLQDFNLPMAPEGTPFQQDVWRLLCNIAVGSRTTYGQITARLGLTREHARAVGTAVGRNPISIAIPRPPKPPPPLVDVLLVSICIPSLKDITAPSGPRIRLDVSFSH